MGGREGALGWRAAIGSSAKTGTEKERRWPIVLHFSLEPFSGPETEIGIRDISALFGLSRDSPTDLRIGMSIYG
jgi:hypothetical protein